MSTVNSILLKTQKALAGYLASKLWSFSPTFYTGQDNETIKLPAILCDCQSATADTAQRRGQWTAEATVHLRENADDTADTLHLEHAGELVDYIEDSGTISGLMSAQPKYIVTMVIVRHMTYALVDRSWETQINVEIKCGGTA